MLFKKILIALTVAVVLLSACKNPFDHSSLRLIGDIKNAPDQNIYLEEFSQGIPQVLDTSRLEKGKFNSSAKIYSESLYRIRFGSSNREFFFINDTNNISVTADLSNPDPNAAIFHSKANSILRNFLKNVDSQETVLRNQGVLYETMKDKKESDSALNAASIFFDTQKKAFDDYVINFIDTVSDPVVVIIAFDKTGSIDPAKLSKVVSKLPGRFPQNNMIASAVVQFNQILNQYNASPRVGSAAPDINFADTSGKPVPLSSFRGKFVLIDFWASWCTYCRKENPNVVKAYNTFKDKNFTVLGVSLDNNKREWINAIEADKLTWNHVSDLQGWNSSVVALYRFNGIPYNVLVDPQGKIIATNLFGDDLTKELSSLLK